MITITALFVMTIESHVFSLFLKSFANSYTNYKSNPTKVDTLKILVSKWNWFFSCLTSMIKAVLLYQNISERYFIDIEIYRLGKYF